MQEFSSISVSTYEPGSLAERLTEKSADGWDVVSIVTTGSTVTAYLSRSTDGAATVGEAAAAPVIATIAAEELVVEESVAPADEPAAAATSDGTGWAMTAGAAATAATPEAEEPAAETVSVQEPAPEPAAEPAAAAPAAAASAAPAGWYADPSSRYELRYWDGSTWTEHVSRAGQQYTDPPVA